MTDYSKMTDEEFDAELHEILEGMKGSQLLDIPGIYEIVAEHFNDEILDSWWDKRRRLILMDIERWDHEDVKVLKALIKEIGGADEIDMSDLPTEPIPEGIELYPVWAMDKKGYCLVGDEANLIEHVDEIMRGE